MTLKPITSLFLILCVSGPWAFSGCDTQDDEHIATTIQHIGVSCAVTATPSVTVTGGFSPAYTSATTYSDCFKGKVVQINGYASKYAVGGYTRVAFADAAPSLADCAESTVGAFLFERRNADWVFITHKEAHGDNVFDNVETDRERPPQQPGRPTTGPRFVLDPDRDRDTLGALGSIQSFCRRPEVFFHSSEMQEGRSYLIVASARLAGTILRKVSFTSSAGTCGQDALHCCWSGEQCASGLACQGDLCEACGSRNAICCGGGTCNSSDLACNGGVCADCGGAGEACCPGRSCDGTLRCQSNNTCKLPPPPPAPPTTQEVCGKVGQVCCSTGDPCSRTLVGYLGGRLMCVPGVILGGKAGCTDNPPGPCNAPGEPCCQAVGNPSPDGSYCTSATYPGLSCAGVSCTTR